LLNDFKENDFCGVGFDFCGVDFDINNISYLMK